MQSDILNCVHIHFAKYLFKIFLLWHPTNFFFFVILILQGRKPRLLLQKQYNLEQI